MSNGFCPFCLTDIIDRAPILELLSDQSFTKFIVQKHPQWSAPQLACMSCLTQLQKEFLPESSLGGMKKEERTIILATDEMIQPAQMEQEAGSLITLHGPDFGKKHNLSGIESIIGRAEGCEVLIRSENVSRQHAKIVRQQGDYILIDLKSTNGTFVNTRKITQHVLHDGDTIMLGNTVLKFVSGSQAETQYYEEIYKLATQDGLTKAHNKMFFLGRLDEEFRRSKRYDRPLSLVLFDFDHFHDLNSTYGHLAGDYVLKTASKLILDHMRKEDVFGRYGGEEFAILLPEISLEPALKLADKFRLMIQDQRFVFDQNIISATVSLGVADLSAEFHSGKELLKAADEALYDAKATGRNKVCYPHGALKAYKE